MKSRTIKRCRAMHNVANSSGDNLNSFEKRLSFQAAPWSQSNVVEEISTRGQQSVFPFELFNSSLI